MHKHASSNRYYRLVWSHVHSCWVAVAEGARGRGKSASRKLTALLVASTLSGAALAAPPGLAGIAAPAPKALPAALAVNALPTGPQVVAGQASVSSTANQMTVNQGSDKAILNWQSFDIGANAGVRFVQPGANSVALNRVLGNDPSRIYGQLQSNGKVFLVNQNGVLFGASARVDVGGLVASSLALPDSDFLAGRYTFSGSADAGAVRNEGIIRTSNGGYVALLGPKVSNAGSIAANNGSVALGAGEQIGVDLRGDGLITLRVDRGAVAAQLENSGLLQADGGRVELSAQGADALARATVNNTGIVRARGLVADGGSIRLVGDGEVHAGALDASSSKGKGGNVAVAGRFVALDGAIDAGGVRGGSVSVDAGGTLSTAAATSAVGRAGEGGSIAYRSAGAVVDSSSAAADASGATKGGNITVQGDASVLSSASYSARSTAGAGGRIDVSGQDVLLLGAQLDASGNTQGGLVRVGGAFQGGAVREDAPDLARFVTRWGQAAPIVNAGSTFINDGTAIKVGASGRNGQGGTAVVWSDRQTTMLGSVDARGAGAAGTVEISSKDTLRHVGLERIALGQGGQLLLDPKNITIGGSGASQWTYQAILGNGYSGGKNASVDALETGDNFGLALALNAAGDRMAVGAPGDDGFGVDSIVENDLGAVRLYSFSDNNFSNATLQGTIGSGYSGGKNLNISLQTGEQFGSAVALNANATSLSVGAPGRDGGAGAVYLFNFSDSQFAAPAVTGALGLGFGTPNLDSANRFGTSVALNGVGNRLAVGSLYDGGANNNCINCGAVYLFNNATSTPSFVKAIGAGYGVNVNLGTEAQFGSSVAFDSSGDRLAVGAYGVNNYSGAVYLFTNTYGATANVATIASGVSGGKNLDPGLAANDVFGSSVALNSAGTRLAVGAPDDGSGKVRIIDFADNAFSAPTVSAVLAAGASGAADANVTLQNSEAFGFSLAMNGAGDRLVVGSPFSEGSGGATPDSGTVRAFALAPLPAVNLGFGTNAAASALVSASSLAATLDSGTSITLQANNDITLEAGNAITIGDGSGNGALTLQAGRSIALNSSITTGNANLTLVANETVANGVVSAQRDAGNATIDIAAGTSINAGSGQVNITLANGAGKANNASGAINVNGSLQGGAVSIKNVGTSANSNVVVGAAGSIAGTGNGLVEIVASNANSAFVNNAGASGLNPGAGRYLVFAANPATTVEGVSGYSKHYAQSYVPGGPGYASSGNWFLYSTVPVLTVNVAAASKTYDGTTGLPALGYTPSGFIDGDTGAVLTGSLGVSGLSRNVGTYTINAGTLGTNLGYAINFIGNNLTVNPRVLNATVSGVNKTYNGNDIASVNFGDDRIGGDVLTVSGTARFADKNAASGKTVTVTGMGLSGSDAANYTLASGTGSTSADIFQRVLNVSVIGLNKTYDGSLDASVALSDNRVTNDVLWTDYGSASFATKDAANGKIVTAYGIGIGGQDAANYTLASTTGSSTANINRRVLTVSAAGQDKTYDGGLAAQATLSGTNKVIGDDLNLAGNAVFLDKNAGAGKTVNVTGIALSGSDANNYMLASTSAGTTASIAKRGLTATASGIGKTYDGNLGASVSFSDNRVSGDVLDYSASASYASKDADLGKAVTVTGITLGGADALNYELVATTGSTTADIARRALTVSATGTAKVYDGNTDAGVTLGDNRVAGDVLAVSAGDARFASKNAGSARAISVSGIAVDGQDAGNYTLSSTTAGASADITQRTLHATVSAQDKVYDGNTTAQLGMQDDRVAGDVLTVSATGASFDTRNVGSNKTVTVSGLGLTGADAGNYVLDASIGAVTAAITPRALNATATAQNKTYDGTRAAMVSLGNDGVSGDQLSLSAGGASFDTKNAGSNKTVTVTGITLGGGDAGNYTLVSDTTQATASVGQRRLVASAVGQDKVYDGGLAATVGFSDDRVNGDVLDYSASASFANKNAGGGKTVSVSGISVSGTDAGNYLLDATTGSTSATILQRTLHASAHGVDKTYDGGLVAGVTFSDDKVVGDVLEYSASASFGDKNAGAGKAVSVSGIVLGGQDAANYTLAADTASTTADIGRRTLVVNASAADKVYDGSTAAGASFSDNRVGGDVLAVAGSAAFTDKNAGSGKLVNVSSLALSGLDAGNYTLAATTATASASIGRRTLNAVVSAQDKVYDGSLAAQVSLSGDQVQGDQLTVNASGASFADKNVGSAKAVSIAGISLAGADADNYVLNATTGSTTAAITQRTLTIGATGVAKVYDGTRAASVVLNDDRVAGDLLAVSNTGAAFGSKDASAGSNILVEGLAFTGQDAGNYVLGSTTANANAPITQRTLHVAASASDKVYDGATWATVELSDDRIAGDQLTLQRNASFADKNAGVGKTVTANVVVAGNDSGNYVIAAPTVSTTATITPRALSAGVIGAVTKTYDGGTSASLAAGQASLRGFIMGEGASVGALAATYNSANVRQATTVQAALPQGAVSAAPGTLLSNYVLPATVSGAAAITTKALTVSGLRANAKVYDGTTVAGIANIGKLDGLVAGESLQLSGPASGQFDNRNAGSGKTVTASGYAIADGAGGLASNYTVANSASATDGVVTQATLTIKANDAKRSAGLPNPGFGYSVSGLVEGDTAAILPQFALATDATLQSAPGSYAITVGSPATLQNYQLAYVNGVLDVSGAAPELVRAIRSTIAPVLPIETAGGANVARQEQRELPRVDDVRAPNAPASVAGPRMDATVVTLSGGTEVFTRNGGVRTQ